MSILALTSDTLVTAASGQIEYNGQFFGTDSNASRAQLQRITSGTSVASTSGTSIDFTSIPSWVKRITVMFAGVSTNGTSPFLVQLGDAGGIENTGYVSSSTAFTGAAGSTSSSTAGFIMAYDTATYIASGSFVLSYIGANLWVGSGTGKFATNVSWVAGGDKTLSDTLTQIRITTVGGANTFDAGTINIMYEG